MEEIMRVAICLSGQPRSWKKCYENWLLNLFPQVQKDIFLHLWDYNTLPSNFHDNCYFTIDDSEKDDILYTLNPKKYLFDSRHINPSGPQEIPKNNFVSTPIGWWCHSQYYSMWHSSRLKRTYEIENKFEYDLVIRLRTDLILTNPIHQHLIDPNTVYTVGNGYISKYNRFLIADTFFYSDSFTFDQVNEYYFSLKFIDAKDVSEGSYEPPPEIGLYPFIKSRGIKNKCANLHTNAQYKLVRPASYNKELGDHETL